MNKIALAPSGRIGPEPDRVGAGPTVTLTPEKRLDVIADAFSRTAGRYEAFGQGHPHLDRLRAKVTAHLERVVAPGSRILELNAGTGVDAVALARRGYRVHATDIAPGMLSLLRDKAADPALDGRVTVQELSFLALDGVTGGPYDAAFSNLGGLDCVPDLRPVVAGLDHVLRPGGTVVWVLMPPVCLWELAEALRGEFRLAVRRLRRRGVQARLEGRVFEVSYFTPAEVVAAFGEGYEVLAIEGLSVITPTAESKGLALRHPTAYGVLAWLDDRLAPRAPFRGWGDFFIVSLRRR